MNQAPNRENAAFDRDIEDRLAALVEVNARLSRDAAARAKYEEELRESEARFRQAARIASLGHYVWDEAGSRYLTISEEVAEIFGVPSDEFMQWRQVLPTSPDERERYVSAVAHTRATGEPFDIEYRIVTPDGRLGCSAIRWPGSPMASYTLSTSNWSEIYTGERIYTRGHLFIPEAHSRTWSRVITSTEDITEYRRAEDANEQLEAQLLHTQKMHVIGQLSGGITHDFNNLLTTILGFADLLELSKVDDLDGKVSAYVKHIKCAGERGRDLVKQMVTFSQRGPTELQTLELPPVVSESVEMLRATFPASVEIEETYAEDLPKVTAGAVHLQQAIVNLCINARDAMSGQGKLRVKLGYTQQVHASCAGCHQTMPGGYVTLDIADTGCGIPSNIRKRMFDPFFTTKPVGQGPGMGLAVVHGIIHRYGGHILVDSTPNEGTTITMLLPGAVSASESRSDKWTTARCHLP